MRAVIVIFLSLMGFVLMLPVQTAAVSCPSGEQFLLELVSRTVNGDEERFDVAEWRGVLDTTHSGPGGVEFIVMGADRGVVAGVPFVLKGGEKP